MKMLGAKAITSSDSLGTGASQIDFLGTSPFADVGEIDFRRARAQ